MLQSMSIISNTSHNGFWICASLMRCSLCKQKQWDLQNVLTRRSKSATARYNLSCTLKSTCHITSHILLETPADNSQMHGRGNDLSYSAVIQRGTFSVFSLVLVGVTFCSLQVHTKGVFPNQKASCADTESSDVLLMLYQ